MPCTHQCKAWKTDDRFQCEFISKITHRNISVNLIIIKSDTKIILNRLDIQLDLKLKLGQWL